MTSDACEFADHARPRDQPTELVRAGARQIVHPAVEAELQDVPASCSDHRLEDGRAGVVRNGCLPEREIRTGIGPVSVRMPGIRSGTGEPVAFRPGRQPPASQVPQHGGEHLVALSRGCLHRRDGRCPRSPGRAGGGDCLRHRLPSRGRVEAGIRGMAPEAPGQGSPGPCAGRRHPWRPESGTGAAVLPGGDWCQ